MVSLTLARQASATLTQPPLFTLLGHSLLLPGSLCQGLAARYSLPGTLHRNSPLGLSILGGLYIGALFSLLGLSYRSSLPGRSLLL